MSPEQIRTDEPTVKEDIYALGALMLVAFTNLMPIKFDTNNVLSLKKKLIDFIEDEGICELISTCMDIEPLHRPCISVIKAKLESFINKIKSTRELAGPLPKPQKTTFINLNKTIQSAINGLANPTFITIEGYWVSKLMRKEEHIGNGQVELALYTGWYTGMAGPLWLIARAKRAGFIIEECTRAYVNSWKYIENISFKNTSAKSPSLFSGSAGITMALAEGLKAGLLLPDEDTLKNIEACLLLKSEDISLSSGIAGQIIALLNSEPWIPRPLFQKLLNSYTTSLMAVQSKDGSWKITSKPTSDKDVSLGLNNGVAGIIWSLLVCFQKTHDSKIEKSIIKAMNWLLKTSFKNNGAFKRNPTSHRYSRERWDFGHGMPGILLCLVRAYEIFKDPIYKEITEFNLQNLPQYPVRMSFTFDSGIVGIGELLLEAYRAFSNSEWKDRSEWVAHFLQLTFKHFDDNSGYWMTDETYAATADFSNGTTGVINFLMRQAATTKLGHPLDPNL